MEEKILLSRVTARLVLSKLARSTTCDIRRRFPLPLPLFMPTTWDSTMSGRYAVGLRASPVIPCCHSPRAASLLRLSVPTLRRRALCLLLLQRFLAQRSWSESCRGSLALSDFLALSRLSSACNTGGGSVCAFVLWSCASPRPACISVAPGGPLTSAPWIDLSCK